MRAETSWHWRAARLALQTAIAVAGIVAIVGSGGGLPDVSFDGGGAIGPLVNMETPLRTVVVGDTVTFQARVINAEPPVTHQWRRNGVDIPGATGTTYMLVGANLGDDGAQFSIHVSASNGTASNTATLQVSPLPAVVFQDGDFALSGWSVSATSTPATGGPTQTVARNDTGGHPDAYRSIAYTMTTGPSSIMAFHSAAAATYDPATQGAIYSIDASVDCIKTGGGQVFVYVMFEQAGRRYDTHLAACTVVWVGGSRLGLRATDFELADGPACAAGVTCPDFSATGAPLRFGLTATSGIGAGQPATSWTQGIDNWRVGVWRR